MSKPKAKGTFAESAVRRYLDGNTPWEWFRPAPAGANDKGDVRSHELPVTLEVKNCARTEIARWVDEAQAEATNAGDLVYAVVHKRRRRGNPGDWFCTMPFDVFVELLREAYK